MRREERARFVSYCFMRTNSMGCPPSSWRHRSPSLANAPGSQRANCQSCRLAWLVVGRWIWLLGRARAESPRIRSQGESERAREVPLQAPVAACTRRETDGWPRLVRGGESGGGGKKDGPDRRLRLRVGGGREAHVASCTTYADGAAPCWLPAARLLQLRFALTHCSTTASRQGKPDGRTVEVVFSCVGVICDTNLAD